MESMAPRRWKAESFSGSHKITNLGCRETEGELHTQRKEIHEGKRTRNSKHSASSSSPNQWDSPAYLASTNRQKFRYRRHMVGSKRGNINQTEVQAAAPDVAQEHIDGINIPALRIAPKHPSLRSNHSLRKSRTSLGWQSQDDIISQLNIRLDNLTRKYNEIRSRNWDMVAEINRLEALSNDDFMQNQRLRRKIRRLRKRETALKSTHAEQLQAKDDKILKFGDTISGRDADIEQCHVQNQQLRESEERLVEEKQALQILVDSRTNIIKMLELKLQAKGSRIQELESTVNLDDHPEKASRLVGKANNMVTKLTQKIRNLIKDLESMTTKYETEKGYSEAARPLMEIGATIRMRYIYQRLKELGIVGELPQTILSVANRRVHWPDIEADLALFKSGVWAVEREGSFFKAVYPTHTVESCISMEARSTKRTLGFMSLGIMYQSLHKEDQYSKYSEEFEKIWKNLQQSLARQSRLNGLETEAAGLEETYIESKLDSLADLMAVFRRAEDTKMAVSWLAQHQKHVEKTANLARDIRAKKVDRQIDLDPTNEVTAATSTAPNLLNSHTEERRFNVDVQNWLQSAPNGGRKCIEQDSKGFVQVMLEKAEKESQPKGLWHADQVMALNDERLRKEWIRWDKLKTLEGFDAKEELFHIQVNTSERDLSVCQRWDSPQVKDLIVLSVD